MLTKKALMTLAAVGILIGLNGVAQAGLLPVFQYSFPDSYDGHDGGADPTIVDLSSAGNNGQVAPVAGDGGYRADMRPPSFDTGGSITGNGGGHGVTDAIDLLTNPLVEQHDGFTFDTWFMWPGTYTSIRKLIDYAGTEALRTLEGEIQFTMYEAPTGGVVAIGYPIEANRWYHVIGQFDTSGNTIDAEGAITGEMTLILDGEVVASEIHKKSVFGDNLDRPIGLNRWPGGGLTGGGDWNQGYIYNPSVYLGIVPEPSSLVMLICGMVGLGAWTIRRHGR